MSDTINQFLERDLSWAAKSAARTGRVIEAVEKLGIGDEEFGDFYASVSSWENPPKIVLRFHDSEGQKDFLRRLLPFVGKFEKDFLETSKTLSFSTLFDGVKICLDAAPPSTCTVEEYEEELPEQPAIPARKVKKYRLVGDCEPVLAGSPTTQEWSVEEP